MAAGMASAGFIGFGVERISRLGRRTPCRVAVWSKWAGQSLPGKDSKQEDELPMPPEPVQVMKGKGQDCVDSLLHPFAIDGQWASETTDFGCNIVCLCAAGCLH